MPPTEYHGMQFNRTFRGCEPTSYNACVGENGEPSYTEYADGFCDAAMHLIDTAIQRQTMDELIYPICFNMRHAIELRLKQFVFSLEWIRDSVGLDDFRDTRLHDLSEIWCYYKKKATEVDKRITKKLIELEPIVADFAEIDPTGQTFRYPYSAEKNRNNKHLVDVGIINVIHLKTVFTKLSKLLQEVHDLNKFLANEYRTGTYIGKLSRADLSDIAHKLPHITSWRQDRGACLEVKKKICFEYDISSNVFGGAKRLIESNYELAEKVGIELSLKQSIICDWIAAYDAFMQTEASKPSDSSSVSFPSASHDMVLQSKKFGEATSYCMGKISVEAFIDIYCVYECGRHGDYCEYYEEIYGRQIEFACAHLKNPEKRGEYVRYLISKTNFQRFTNRGLRMLKQGSILAILEERYPMEFKC